MQRVKDKVILVTGAAMGMGQSHSELLAAEGARVFVADLNAALGEAVAEGIRQRGGQAEFLKLDVTAEADWNAAVARIIERAGRIDVLVNNAGILISKPVQDTTNEDWDRIFAVNVRGTFLGTRAVIPHMRQAGRGNIINISSIYGLVGAPNACAYEASKGAVRLFTKACAADLAPFGIRVNSIHPGVIETPMTREALADKAHLEQLLGPTLLKRPAKPIEVSQAVLFLASDESSFVHGAELVVDGGYTAN
ncbi:MAG: glucose 1-dehydrogenase [Fulvimonas sp.]|jgi:cyclopentanol dehydrogenase|nr:glucose 1-dehydrogenase [Fulvimonas sp.]